MKKVIKYLLIYFPFLLITLFVGMLSWTLFVDGNLYYCSDKFPLLDFIPPFVHTGKFGPTGDYFIVDQKIVWAVWLLHLGLILYIPTFITKKFFNLSDFQK